MTLHRFRGKQQQNVSKHPDCLYLSPKPKLSSQDVAPIISHHDLHSHSKGKHKLKMHIFKSKNVNNQEQIPAMHQKETLQTYLSSGNLRQEGQKPKFNARKFLAERNALLSAKEKRVKQKNEPPKKQKKEFKLIHQIKQEKASKLEEKIRTACKPVHMEESKATIEAASHKKMDGFVEEMQLILEPQHSPHRSSIDEYLRVEDDREQPDIQTIRAETKIHKEKSSIVRMNIPSSLMRSQDYSFLISQKPKEEEQKVSDLNRSLMKASKLLKMRKDSSSSSIDLSLRGSKVRAQISISLALQSRHESRIDLSAFYKDLHVKTAKQERVTCRDKIRAHLQILQSISNFVYESTKFDEIGDEWEELNFLIYKKFYIERRKVVNFIQKYPMKNPFCIDGSQIKSKDIIEYMKTQEGVSLLNDLKEQTLILKQKLTKIYSKFDKRKVGEKINLYEYDNFSHWIIEELWAELILTEHNTIHSREEINIRLCRILQLIFLVSELNGKYECSFQEAETAIGEGEHSVYIKEGKQIFQRYILCSNEETI